MVTSDMLQPGTSFVSIINPKRRFTVTKRHTNGNGPDRIEYFYDHWTEGEESGTWDVVMFTTCICRLFEPEFIANEEDLWE